MLLHRNRTALVVGTAVVAVLLTACSDGTAVERRPAAAPDHGARSSAAPKPAKSERPSPTATSSSTASSDPTVAATSTAPAPPKSAALADRLLTAAQMPGFNEHFAWREAETRDDEGSEPFGTCQRYSMTAIGALRLAVREYTPVKGPEVDTAGELVAEFPDQRTAKRAFAVLRSWREQCDEQLSKYERRRVGDLERVDVAGADTDARWYLLSYGPPEGGSEDEGWFDSQGLVRAGSRIAVLRMRLLGQDFNYPAGQEPMVKAVRRAAARLG
jgi:hypothetical protein